MFFKSLVLVIVCEFVSAERIEFPPELQTLVSKLHDDCMLKQGLSEEDFKAFDLEKKTPEMMCYIKCVFLEGKWMNEDEVVQTDYIKENIHEAIKDVTVPHLEDCGKKAEEGIKCEKSYNFLHCLNQAEPENWRII